LEEMGRALSPEVEMAIEMNPFVKRKKKRKYYPKIISL